MVKNSVVFNVKILILRKTYCMGSRQGCFAWPVHHLYYTRSLELIDLRNHNLGFDHQMVNYIISCKVNCKWKCSPGNAGHINTTGTETFKGLPTPHSPPPQPLAGSKTVNNFRRSFLKFPSKMQSSSKIWKLHAVIEQSVLVLISSFSLVVLFLPLFL